MKCNICLQQNWDKNLYVQSVIKVAAHWKKINYLFINFKTKLFAGKKILLFWMIK